MARAHRTILFALTLAVPLAAQNAPAAQTTPEDPPPAIVEGSVINIQNSRTIPRATVTLLHLKGTGSKSQRADGSGHFMFKNVEPGIYRLMAERQGFFSDDRKREHQPQFEVAVGAHIKNLPVRLMPAAVVSGEVLDEYSDPVQDAEIRLLAVQIRLGQMDLRVAGKAMTNDRGEYRVAGLHPGKYYIVVEYKSKALAIIGHCLPGNAQVHLAKAHLDCKQPDFRVLHWITVFIQHFAAHDRDRHQPYRQILDVSSGHNFELWLIFALAVVGKKSLAFRH